MNPRAGVSPTDQRLDTNTPAPASRKASLNPPMLVSS